MNKESVYEIVTLLLPSRCEFLGETTVKSMIEKGLRGSLSPEHWNDDDGLFHFQDNFVVISCVLTTIQTVIIMLQFVQQIKPDKDISNEIAEKMLFSLRNAVPMDEHDENRKENICAVIKRAFEKHED